MKAYKFTFLFLLLLPFTMFSQSNPLSEFKRFGLGIGYSSNSVVGDSIRPAELSLHFRINDRHTLQLYAPLSYKRSILQKSDNTRKETLWGLGLGYDYTFFRHSYLNFFAGLSTDYQWYQIRQDRYYKGPKYTSDGTLYEVEDTYYFWHKVNGFVVNPNIGMQMSFRSLVSEIAINLPASKLKKEAYSQRVEIEPAAKSTYESFYPDKKINEMKITPYISTRIILFF